MTDKKNYKSFFKSLRSIFPDYDCLISAEDVLAFKPSEKLVAAYGDNSNWCKSQLERMHRRYGAPLMHHGDCSIYRADLPVCTCGLLHDLMPMGIEIMRANYPGIEKDWETEAAWKKACYEQYSLEDGSE